MSADTAKEYPGTARKKHRHDLGHEDHGPVLAERTTRAIQGLLGLWIALTFAAVLWLLVDASRNVPIERAPAAATETAAH